MLDNCSNKLQRLNSKVAAADGLQKQGPCFGSALALLRVPRKVDKWWFLIIILFTGDLRAENCVSRSVGLG